MLRPDAVVVRLEDVKKDDIPLVVENAKTWAS